MPSSSKRIRHVSSSKEPRTPGRILGAAICSIDLKRKEKHGVECSKRTRSCPTASHYPTQHLIRVRCGENERNLRSRGLVFGGEHNKTKHRSTSSHVLSLAASHGSVLMLPNFIFIFSLGICQLHIIFSSFSTETACLVTRPQICTSIQSSDVNMPFLLCLLTCRRQNSLEKCAHCVEKDNSHLDQQYHIYS